MGMAAFTSRTPRLAFCLAPRASSLIHFGTPIVAALFAISTPSSTHWGVLPRGPLGPHGGHPPSFSFTWGALLGMTDWSLPVCFTFAWGVLRVGLLACPTCPPDPTAVTSAPRLLPHFCMGSLPGVTFLSICLPPPLHGVGGLVASPPAFCRYAALSSSFIDWGPDLGWPFFTFPLLLPQICSVVKQQGESCHPWAHESTGTWAHRHMGP